MKLHLTNWLAVSTSLAVAVLSSSSSANTTGFFNRISTFEVCEQIDANCNTDTETVAEIVWFFSQGNTKNCLVYTDGEQEQLGFVDVTDPSNPVADGVVQLPGEPTTVRTIGDFVVVGVNTSPDFVNPSGDLVVLSASDRSVVATIPLAGQPDAVDVSKEDSGFPKYITIAIENERDEDLGDGYPPQLPPGFLEIMTIPDAAALADPTKWIQSTVDLTGFDGVCRFPTDPEPEYVCISGDNKSVLVTLQENNCNILVDLETGTVTNAFDAGSVSLTNIDVLEEDVIHQNASGTFLREADGATWIGDTTSFATANEGDLDGGSRGFSIFDSQTGAVQYDSGNFMDLEVVKIGHYNDGRSGNKGNEPENVLYGETDTGSKFLFVAAERSNCVFVYEISNPTVPVFLQILPSGVGPEGMAFDKKSGVLAVAGEKDDREDGFRASVTFYKLQKVDQPAYPTLESMPRTSLPETYIPFSALSGLAASPTDPNIVFTVEDKEFRQSRILCIDTSVSPACVVMEDYIMDTNGELAKALAATDPDIVNDDMTVNLDMEGIAANPMGGFWVVSKKHKALICVSENHVVEMVIFLEVGMDNLMGVEVDGDNVVVIQGEADDDKPNPLVVVYNTATDTTKCAQFVLEAPESQNGGKVCLTDIASAGNGMFFLLQADDQAGKDSAIKRIDSIDLGDYSFEDNVVLNSTAYRDLIPDLTASNGVVPKKVEGLTVDSNGNVFVVNDNDGVGETFFLKVASIKEEEKSSKSGKKNKSDKKSSKSGKKNKSDKKDKSSKKKKSKTGKALKKS